MEPIGQNQKQRHVSSSLPGDAEGKITVYDCRRVRDFILQPILLLNTGQLLVQIA